MPSCDFGPRQLAAGDLLEVEARYVIENGEVCVDFSVLWRHPTQGVSGVYRAGGCDFGDLRAFGPDHLAEYADCSRASMEALPPVLPSTPDLGSGGA
jgi:hypothetical protein